MDKCSAVMLSGHKPQVADAVIEAPRRLHVHPQRSFHQTP